MNMKLVTKKHSVVFYTDNKGKKHIYIQPNASNLPPSVTNNTLERVINNWVCIQ